MKFCISVYQSSFFLSAPLSVSLSLSISVSPALSILVSVYLCLSLSLSLCLYAAQSFYAFVYLSIHMSYGTKVNMSIFLSQCSLLVYLFTHFSMLSFLCRADLRLSLLFSRSNLESVMMAETNIDPLMVNISPIGRKNQMPFAVFSVKVLMCVKY